MKSSTFIAGSIALFLLGVLQGMWLNTPVILLGILVVTVIVFADQVEN